MGQEEARRGRREPLIDKYADDLFTNQVTTLVALLVVSGREEEAKEIAAAARRERDAPSFNAAVEKALGEVVPDPWP